MNNNRFIIFTDGACAGNPGPGAWGAVILELKTSCTKIFELGEYDGYTTNNMMELTAILKSLEYLNSSKGKIKIYSDSKYAIKGIYEWVPLWIKNQWQTKNGSPVLNKPLWENIHSELIKRRDNSLGEVSFSYVPGHSGIAGNERADLIATTLIKERRFNLFEGSTKDYEVSINLDNLDFEIKQAISKKAVRKSSKKPYSYISLLRGKILIHKTWLECERRVKGESNAKFKKVMSKEEESQVIEEWKKNKV